MMLFREAQDSDLNAIHQLAITSGIGLTTLPKEKVLLQKRIDWSLRSLKKKSPSPESEYYFFVLENTETKKVVGTSAIETVLGSQVPFYSYKITHHKASCPTLKIEYDYSLLNLTHDYHGANEICTLYLDKAYRDKSNGLLLSRARFLFMHNHPNRFAKKVIADLRGVSDEKGHSPFWDSHGAHFFKMSYEEADRLTLLTNKEFIADLMPKHPIYVPLLSKAAQAVLGKPHPSTIKAMHILLHEGFVYNHYMDIFDAGPTLEASLDSIHTIKASHTYKINAIEKSVLGEKVILSNTKLPFRAFITSIKIDKNNHYCILSKEAAALLQVETGDKICASPIYSTLEKEAK